MKTDIKSLNDTFRKLLRNTNAKMLLCALLLFISVILYLPQSSVIRTIPLVLLFSAASFGVYPNLVYNLGVHFTLSFLFYIVYGSSLIQSVIFSALAVFYSLCAIFILILVLKYRGEKSAINKKRCIMYIAVCFAVSVIIYCFTCGNVFSATTAHSTNAKYVRENYGDKVKVMHTNFDFATRTYRTHIKFDDDGYKVGAHDMCFVSNKKGKITDGYRDYFEDKMLFDSQVILSGIIENCTDAFQIAESDIEFENGEILSQNPDCREFFDRTSYVVAFYSIVNTKDEFSRLVKDCISELAKHDEFTFEKIVFCAGNASEFKFILEYTHNVTTDKIDEMIVPYSDKLLKGTGVTGKTLMEFWQNK